MTVRAVVTLLHHVPLNYEPINLSLFQLLLSVCPERRTLTDIHVAWTPTKQPHQGTCVLHVFPCLDTAVWLGLAALRTRGQAVQLCASVPWPLTLVVSGCLLCSCSRYSSLTSPSTRSCLFKNSICCCTDSLLESCQTEVKVQVQHGKTRQWLGTVTMEEHSAMQGRINPSH